MREIITAFIIVFTLQIVTNNPPLPEVQAQPETKQIQAPQEPKKVKVTNHATKKQKPISKPQKQPVAIPRVVQSSVDSNSGNCGAYRGLVAKYFPSHEVNNALLTMSKESGCNVMAKSATDDHGLMQVNCYWHCAKVGGDVNRLYDPETNIRLAKQIFDGRGWKAWYAVRGILW